MSGLSRIFPIGFLFLLATGGCYPSITSMVAPDRVTYELQVREPGSRAPLTGAAIHAEPGRGVGESEGTTDRDGIYRLDFTMPLFSPSIFRYSSQWLRISVRKEGCDPLTLDLGDSHFLREGRHLRRAEAVTLRKAAP